MLAAAELRVLALFAGLYGAYGCLSPVLPNLLAARGLGAGEIGLVLGAATLVRLVAAPLAGRAADASGAAGRILALSALVAGLAALAHLPVSGLGPVLLAGLAYALGTAPLAPLADALALGAARGGVGLGYGRVRAAGSLAFVAASAGTGWLVAGTGLDAALAAGALLFAGAAALAWGAPAAPVRAEEAPAERRDLWRDLLRIAPFRRTLLVAALVVGAHGMHETFAMIRWRAAGIGAETAGLLWAEAVAAEVAVFLLLGPPLLGRLGPAGAMALAAGAGALRWAVAAETAALPWLAGAQALHGLSFALLHLACLDRIAAVVPGSAHATALSLYASTLGLAGAGVTLAAGPLYGAFGAQAFWATALMSLAALPLVPALARR